MAPEIEQLSERFLDVVFLKVDVESGDDGEKYGIRAMPTFKLFLDKAELESIQGAAPAAVEAALRKHAHKATAESVSWGTGGSRAAAGGGGAGVRGAWDAGLTAEQREAASTLASLVDVAPAAVVGALRERSWNLDAAIDAFMADTDGFKASLPSVAPSESSVTITAASAAAAAVPVPSGTSGSSKIQFRLDSGARLTEYFLTSETVAAVAAFVHNRLADAPAGDTFTLATRDKGSVEVLDPARTLAQEGLDGRCLVLVQGARATSFN